MHDETQKATHPCEVVTDRNAPTMPPHPHEEGVRRLYAGPNTGLQATDFERTECGARELRDRIAADWTPNQVLRVAIQIATARDIDLDDLLDTQQMHYPCPEVAS